MYAAGHQPTARIQTEADNGPLLPLAVELDRGGDQLAGALTGRRLDAHHDGHRDRQDLPRIAVEVQVDDVLSGHDAARVGDLVVEAGDVAPVA